LFFVGGGEDTGRENAVVILLKKGLLDGDGGDKKIEECADNDESNTMLRDLTRFILVDRRIIARIVFCVVVMVVVVVVIVKH
jgi:hypothetical protein